MDMCSRAIGYLTVCALLLEDLLQSCSRGGGRRVEDFECVCVLLLQDLSQRCSRGGGRRVEDMCYERRRAEACVDDFVTL